MEDRARLPAAHTDCVRVRARPLTRVTVLAVSVVGHAYLTKFVYAHPDNHGFGLGR
jgi:hypothetical protein